MELSIIKQPVCEECGSKDIRIMMVDSPKFYEIVVLLACFSCKNKFVGTIKLENEYEKEIHNQR